MLHNTIIENSTHTNYILPQVNSILSVMCAARLHTYTHIHTYTHTHAHMVLVNTAITVTCPLAGPTRTGTASHSSPLRERF